MLTAKKILERLESAFPGVYADKLKDLEMLENAYHIQPEQLYRKAVESWGLDAQMWMLAEECGELVSATSQIGRGRINYDAYAAEIADVLIMVSQIIVAMDDLFGKESVAHSDLFTRLVFAAMLKKLNRLQARLGIPKTKK